MNNLIRNTLLPLFIMLSSLSCTAALAKDLSVEQFNVTAAREAYMEAQVNYDAATQSVKDQEKRVAQERSRLKDQQQKQAAAKTRLTKAKSHLDKQLEYFDKVWKTNGN